MRVFVLNMRGQPLMPTTPRKARVLLRDNKAKVVKRNPFTIQLKYATGEAKQEINLGVDAGSKHIGVSATTEKEVLFEAEIELRNNIVELLATRRQYRRSRRNRKTRYRQARFNNRKREKGWLAPSIQHKIEAHIKTITMVHKILPISKIIIEVAQFDMQKIKNPNIEGKEYQQGDQLGFWNVREYVLWRDNHKCKGKPNCKNKILNVHHIESRKIGGDAPNNLITLCEKCHSDLHAGKLKLNLKRGTSYRDAAFMGIMRWAVYNKLKSLYPNVSLTYGYITKNTRIGNNLEKSHIIDARCISKNPLAKPPSVNFYLKHMRKQNRQLHKANPKKGKRQANKAVKYIFGYQLFDKVEYENQECFIFGRRSSGYFDLRKLDGTKISASANYKKLKLLEKTNTVLTERRYATSSP